MIRLRRAGSVGFAAIALTLFGCSCGSDAKLTSSSSSPAGGAAATVATAVNDTSASAPPSGSTPSAVDTTPSSSGTEPPTSPGASSGSSSASTPATDDIDPGLDDDIFTATADLATHLGVDASTIETVSATMKEWPNGALGCPRPGVSYTQVTVDGAEIVLRAGGKDYSYHEGGSKGPFLCAPATLTTTPSGPSPSMATATLPGG